MPVPKTVTKYSKKNGVTFTSNVDRVEYTLHELSRAALKDVGKVMTKEVKKDLERKTGRLHKNTQYWVRYRQKHPDLQIGFKPGGFYGIFQELGTEEIPKVGALRNTVYKNIPLIVKIESKYLSALENEARALSMIDESEEEG